MEERKGERGTEIKDIHWRITKSRGNRNRIKKQNRSKELIESRPTEKGLDNV